MRKLIKIILLFLLFVNFSYVLSGAIHYPLRSIDVYSIWLFKAKAFWVSGGFPLEFLRTHLYSHPQYPILLPWLFYQIYQIVGGVREMYVLILYPFIYLTILVLAYKFFLEMKLGKLTSLFFIYIYSMISPLLAQGGRMHAGTADIVLVLIYWMIANLSLHVFRDKRANLVFAIAALAAISSQIKPEGVFVSLLILFLPVNKNKKTLAFLISLLPSVAWIYSVRSLEISNDFGFFIPNLGLIVKRLILVFASTVKEMLNIRNWYVFWILFWILLFIQRGKSTLLKKVFQPTGLLIFLMFLGVYLAATINTEAYLSSSLDRVLLQLSPFFYPVFVHRINLLLNKLKQVG